MPFKRPESQTISKFIGYKELTTVNLWKSIIAELFGTLFLVFIGCGTCVKWLTKVSPDADLVQISLCFGISVAVIVQCTCHISGGHINPAVSLGMLVSGNISLIRYILYVIFQSGGAVIGAGILDLLTPVTMISNLGVTPIYIQMNAGQAIGVEICVTFVLVFTVFAVCDSKRVDVKGSPPLMIGLSVVICHLFAVPYTGCSMNPARSLGPAVIMNIWNKHWVFWVGPNIGGMLAALFYKLMTYDSKSRIESSSEIPIV